MSTYIVKRLLLMIPTLFGITFLTYVIIRNAPGDPTAMKGDMERGPKRDTLTAGDQGDYKKLLHLDKAPHIAYFYWVKDFFNPKQNVSAKYKVYVFDVILERLPNTLALNFYAILILYCIGIPLGIDSAVNARSVRERVLTVLLFLFYSLPSFWVGLNLIVAFGRGGFLHHWLPMGLQLFRILVPVVIVLFVIQNLLRDTHGDKVRGVEISSQKRAVQFVIGGAAWVALIAVLGGTLALLGLMVGNGLSLGEMAALVLRSEVPQRLVGFPIAGLEPDNAKELSYLTLLRAGLPFYFMPIFCMSYAGLAGESRYMRVGLMEILRQDYIRTARAKGVSETKVLTRHALPNALTPIIVQLAGLFPGMIGGSVIVETIFSVPGMGLLFFEAVQARDYNLVMAEVFMGAVLVLFGILVSDLLLPLLDPRVSFEAKT